MVKRSRTNITRRDFAGICIGIASAGAGAFHSDSQVHAGQSISQLDSKRRH